MFRPNQTGLLHSRVGRDKYARETFADPISISLAVVRLEPVVQKTTVRADSSASRGGAEEISLEGIILVGPTIDIRGDDIVEVHDRRCRVVMVHPRFSVLGVLDHQEVTLGAPPS